MLVDNTVGVPARTRFGVDRKINHRSEGMVHIMNNGPSAVIAPTGEILSLTPAQQAGGYLVNIPHSSAAGNTVYTRYPWLFSSICRWSLLLCALWAWCSPLLGAADQIRWINSSRGKR